MQSPALAYMIPLRKSDPFASVPRPSHAIGLECYETAEALSVLKNTHGMVVAVQDAMGITDCESASSIRSNLSGGVDPAREGNEWREHVPAFQGNHEQATEPLTNAYAKAPSNKEADDVLNDAVDGWWTQEDGKLKTPPKAIGVVAGVIALITLFPKLVHMITEGQGKRRAEVKDAFIDLCGLGVWKALVQGGLPQLRHYLSTTLSVEVCDTFVATLAIEGLVAVFLYMTGNTKAKMVLQRISAGVSIACTAAIYNLQVMKGTMQSLVKQGATFGRNEVFAFVEKIPAFVQTVCDILTAKVGVVVTIVGVSLLLASQTGNAVMLIGMLGASASTGTAISALSGAAATKAALAWLGGGTVANGGGGIVVGKALLSLASGVGYALSAIGVCILILQVVNEALKRFKSITQAAVEQLGEKPDKDNESDVNEYAAYRKKIASRRIR